MGTFPGVDKRETIFRTERTYIQAHVLMSHSAGQSRNAREVIFTLDGRHYPVMQFALSTCLKRDAHCLQVPSRPYVRYCLVLASRTFKQKIRDTNLNPYLLRLLRLFLWLRKPQITDTRTQIRIHIS